MSVTEGEALPPTAVGSAADDGPTSRLENSSPTVVPGEGASSYSGCKILQSALRQILKCRCKFSSFCRVFLFTYSTLDGLPSGESGGTALSLFPMPLPYREATFAASEDDELARKDLPRKQAMNVITFALNFLAAGRALQPPVLMGRRLSSRQRQAVRRMEQFLEAWLCVSPIGPSEMGVSILEVLNLALKVEILRTGGVPW